LFVNSFPETPIITGEDARRFDKAMENLKPVPEERKQEIQKSYDLFKSRATFPMM
jgi:hypothetical protein